MGITNSDNSRSTGKHLDKFTQESGVETCSEKGNNVECKCPERHYKNDRIAYIFWVKIKTKPKKQILPGVGKTKKCYRDDHKWRDGIICHVG